MVCVYLDSRYINLENWLGLHVNYNTHYLAEHEGMTLSQLFKHAIDLGVSKRAKTKQKIEN